MSTKTETTYKVAQYPTSNDKKEHFKTWSGLSKLYGSGWATCSLEAKGGNYTKPSYLYTYFQGLSDTIPQEATVNSIKVTIYDYTNVKGAKLTRKVKLMSGGRGSTNYTAFKTTGGVAANTKDVDTYTFTQADTKTDLTTIVRKGFSAGVVYGANTTKDKVTLNVDYVKITVDYTLPKMKLAVSTTKANNQYKNTIFPITFSLTNTTTTYNPGKHTVINLPPFMEFMGLTNSVDDVLYDEETHTLVWNVNNGKKLGKAQKYTTTLNFRCEHIKDYDVVLNSVDYTGKSSTSATGHFTIGEKPFNVIYNKLTENKDIIDGNVFEMELIAELGQDYIDATSQNIYFKTSDELNYNSVLIDDTVVSLSSLIKEDDYYIWTPNLSPTGQTTSKLKIIANINLTEESEEISISYKYQNLIDEQINYHVYPKNLINPYFTYLLFDKDNETLQRMGDNIEYDVGSSLYVHETDANAYISLYIESLAEADGFLDTYEIVNLTFKNSTYNNSTKACMVKVELDTSELTSQEIDILRSRPFELSLIHSDGSETVLAEATPVNNILTFNWTASELYDVDDIARISNKNFYDNGIPDYINNHRVGVFNSNPLILFEDIDLSSDDWLLDSDFERNTKFTTLSYPGAKCVFNSNDPLNTNYDPMERTFYNVSIWKAERDETTTTLYVPRDNLYFAGLFDDNGNFISDWEKIEPWDNPYGYFAMFSFSYPNTPESKYYTFHNQNWEDDEGTILIAKHCTFNRTLPVDGWKISFITSPITHYFENGSSPYIDCNNLKGISIDETYIPFSTFLPDITTPHKITIEWTGEQGNIYVDDGDTWICLDIFTATENTKFKFTSHGADFNIKDFKLEKYLPEDAIIDYSSVIENIYEKVTWAESPVSKVNTWEENHVQFVYNEKYPLLVFLSGEPLSMKPSISLSFAEPYIVESDTGITPTTIKDVPYYPEGKYFYLVNNTLSTEEYGDIVGSSSQHLYWDFPELEDIETGTDYSIQGIEFSFDVNGTSEETTLLVSVKCKNKQGDKSINLENLQEEQTVTLGGSIDRWGLKITDFTDLDNSLEVIIQNIGEEDHLISINNPVLKVYYDEVSSNVVSFGVSEDTEDWELSQYYGLFIQDIKINEGADFDVQYYTITGTDTNDAYRMNLQPKEINIDYAISGCDITETTWKLRQLNKLLSNRRDELNRPIVKYFRASNYPDLVFEYVKDSEITVNHTVGAEIEGTIKLTVPSGTALKIEDTVTNYTGVNSSPYSCLPIIELSQLQEKTIIITNTINNGERIDSLTINLPDNVSITKQDILTLDCKNRVLTYFPYNEAKEEYDPTLLLTTAVDPNSKWFVLLSDEKYEFDCDGNANVESVSYNERW